MNNRYFLLLLWVLVPAAFLSGCATGQSARSLTDRYDEVAAKIDEAETLGARDCSPRELAYARVELAHARHEWDESDYSTGLMHAKFDHTEMIANELLTKRRLDASQGACR